MDDVDNTGRSPTLVTVTPMSAHPILDEVTQEFLDQAGVLGALPTYGDGDGAAKFGALQFCEPDAFATSVEDVRTPNGANGPIDIRLVRPLNASSDLPILLYFPGFGWMAGDGCSTHDRFARQIAGASNIAVVMVAYTKAPDARFAAQIEQGCAVREYLLEHGRGHGLDASRLAIGGDGVGANMAAALCILIKQRRQASPLLQFLLCPMTADRLETESSIAFAQGPWLTRRALDTFIDAYLGTIPAKPNPLAFPLEAEIRDLQGLPPALIITAENDMLRDEGEAYARRLIRAGVEVCATRYLATIHDFLIIDWIAETPAARGAMAQVQSELRRYLV